MSVFSYIVSVRIYSNNLSCDEIDLFRHANYAGRVSHLYSKTLKKWRMTSNWSFFSAVSGMCGLLKLGIFFVMYRSLKMNMNA